MPRYGSRHVGAPVLAGFQPVDAVVGSRHRVEVAESTLRRSSVVIPSHSSTSAGTRLWFPLGASALRGSHVVNAVMAADQRVWFPSMANISLYSAELRAIATRNLVECRALLREQLEDEEFEQGRPASRVSGLRLSDSG